MPSEHCISDRKLHAILSPASDEPAVRVRLRRADRVRWPDLAHLFPHYSVNTDMNAPVACIEPVVGSGTGRNLRFSTGLLRGPGFTPAANWVSGTVAGEVERALAAPDRRDAARREAAMRLTRKMAAARVGGGFWEDALPEGPERIVLRPAMPSALESLLAGALSAHEAGKLLLLLPARTPRLVAEHAARSGVVTMQGLVDPWSVLDRASALHVGGDDELALIGVLTGRKVHCHAPGLVAGWGLTTDRPGLERRPRRDVADLAAAALLDGVRYADPRTRRPIDCDAAIELLAEWRELVRRNRAIGCCVGISFWKRARIAAFFHDGRHPPAFRRHAEAAVAASGGRAIAAWNSRIPPGLAARAAGANIPLLRVEDGFIRSSGLGSGFLPPASIIADSRGIYYDPSRASDLEHILSETTFDDTTCRRAAALIARLTQRGVTKYGAGGHAPRLEAPPGRRVILVPGQVADDLSVALGGGAVRSNLALLEAVRAANPLAWLVYKPHPDVEAGHRPGRVAAADLARFADQVVREGAMSALIQQVDAVHTMTSLAGFEALLRGRKVTALGQPFYAGWGLTTDLAPLARRTRRLTIEELAAGVLILYPRYLDPQSGLPCGPELLIDRLEQPELWRPSGLMRLRHLQGKLKRRLQTR